MRKLLNWIVVRFLIVAIFFYDLLVYRSLVDFYKEGEK